MRRPPAIDCTGLAELLGREVGWVHRHWRRLVDERGLPQPLPTDGPPAWSRAQVHAWLDAPLSPALRRAALAYRLAEEAFERAELADDHR